MVGRCGMSGLLILCLVSSCAEPATQLVVVVDSDLAAGDRVSIRAVARPGDDPTDMGAESTFDIADAPGPATFVLPLSFGVVPPGSDPARRVEVAVEARNAGDEVTVTRRARTGFVRGRTLRLPMFLAAACRGLVCSAGQTCDAGVCVSDEIPTESLMEVNPGGELDGGPRSDAGAPGCAPVSATPVLSVPRSPFAVAIEALPATSEWAIACDADTETLFAVATGDGSMATAALRIATSGAWGLTMQPRTDDPERVDVAHWPARDPRTFVMNTAVDASGSSPALSTGILSQGQLDSRGVSARLGGANVFVLQHNLSREAVVTGFEGGDPVSVGFPETADTWIASRAGGDALWASNDAATPECRIANVNADRTADPPVAVPITGSGCARVAVAELSDGRVMMAYVADLTARYAVLDASLGETGVAGIIGSAPVERIDLWPGDDGSARVVMADGAGGILTARLEADGTLPVVSAVDDGGATIDAASVRSSRMGDATGITFYSASAGAMMLVVVCEP